MLDAEPTDTSDRRTYELHQGSELRIEVKTDHVVSVLLQSGEAEIFGTTLIVGQPIALRSQKVAVYTWNGCTIDVFTEDYPIATAVDLMYEADETPMPLYLNTHHALHMQREQALNTGAPGPRFMVVGPTDSGKSTLCKTLANYAVRQGSVPVVVDLDIGQGSLTPPGTICATPCEAPVDIEEGLAVDVPLVYYFGHVSPSENDELYRRLVQQMGSMLDARASASSEANAAGLIVNTMGWVDGLGFELLLHSILALRVDTVAVLGDDRLFNQLQSTFKQQRGGSEVRVVKLSKSGGVVTRPSQMRKEARTQRVRDYFYGPRNDLSPHVVRLKFDEVSVYRIGGGPRAPSSALPIGTKSVADPMRVSRVAISMDLLHTLLGISHAREESEMVSANIAGFLYVKDIDLTEQTLVCLAPSAGELPGRLLLAGSFKTYFD